LKDENKKNSINKLNTNLILKDKIRKTKQRKKDLINYSYEIDRKKTFWPDSLPRQGVKLNYVGVSPM